MGNKSMRVDVNTKPVQGLLFRIFWSDMMGVQVEYDDDVERRRTHPLLLPKIDTEILSLPDGDILENIAVVVPVKKVAKLGPVDKKRTIQGSKCKLISPRAKTLDKQKSVLVDTKYGTGPKPHWKSGSAHYLDFYKALLDEPSITKRIEMMSTRGASSSMRNQ